MGEVIYLNNRAAGIENGASFRALVVEAEALLVLQQAALANLRGAELSSDSQIAILGNTMELLRNHLRSLRAMLPPH